MDESIGLGVSSLLIEALFETGCFDLIDGEDEIRERHGRLLQRTEDGFYVKDEPFNGMKEPEYRMDAEVSYATSSGSSISVGPIGWHKQKFRVSLNACLQSVSSAECTCHGGQGETEQTAWAAIFEFQGDPDEFKKTAAGLATQRAIQQAVDRLVQSIQPANWKGE